jgi:hypothetical protein
MNVPSDKALASAPALASEWYDSFQREALADDGDPEAFISSVREVAEQAGPESSPHKAFALFVERLREDDIDLEEDELD